MHGCTAEEAEPGLTEEQLMEVFKQTSIFNVRSAMAGNEALLGPEVDATEDDRRAECCATLAVHAAAPVAPQWQPAPGVLCHKACCGARWVTSRVPDRPLVYGL